MTDVWRALTRHKRELTREQYRTIKGQILAGDKAGAIKGIMTCIQKNGGVKNASRQTQKRDKPKTV